MSSFGFTHGVRLLSCDVLSTAGHGSYKGELVFLCATLPYKTLYMHGVSLLFDVGLRGISLM